VQHTFENQEQSNANVSSSLIEQPSKEEKVEDICVTSNSLTTPVTVHLPLAEVNAEETSTLTAEADKQLEIISTPEEDLSQKTYNSDDTSTTISDNRQSPILLEMKQDENVALSSDSLADIIRQILSTTLPIHHPSVDHTSIINEQTDTIIPSSEPTAHIEDNELPDSNKTLSITETNPITEIISKIPTTLTEVQTTLTSENIKDESLHNANQESNSSLVINHIDTEAIPDVDDILRQSTCNQSFPLDTVESEKIRSELPDQDYFKFEQTWPDFTLTDEKNLIPDVSKNYYELQDQRRVQSVLNYEQIEKKQKPSNINLHNQPQHLGLESFSLISNLPSREYRQVFGASDEVVTKVEELTNQVASNTDQQSNISDDVTPIIFGSNEKPEMIETLEDYSSIVSPNQVFTNEEKTSEDRSISYNELDSRYSTLIDRINSLIQPLLTDSSIIDNQPIQLEIKNKEDDDQRHLRERYDVLIDHVKRLEEAIHANLIDDTVDAHKQLSSDDQLINSQDNLVETTEQRLNTPLLAVTSSYEKTSDELNNQKEDEQHQPLITGLFEIMKSLLSKAASITSSDINETISSKTILTSTNIPTPPSDNMIDNGDCQPSVEESSSIITKPTTITSSTDIKNEGAVRDDDDKEHHGLVDFIVRAVSNVKETNDNTQQPTVPNNDEEKQTFIETAKKVIVGTYEKIVPTLNQSTSSVSNQIQTTTSGYP
jgi:hypothetical protein